MCAAVEIVDHEFARKNLRILRYSIILNFIAYM